MKAQRRLHPIDVSDAAPRGQGPATQPRRLPPLPPCSNAELQRRARELRSGRKSRQSRLGWRPNKPAQWRISFSQYVAEPLTMYAPRPAAQAPRFCQSVRGYSGLTGRWPRAAVTRSMAAIPEGRPTTLAQCRGRHPPEYPLRGLNAHAVEERPSAGGVGVGVAGRARLPHNVLGQERERRGQIRAVLQEIVHAGDALPCDTQLAPEGRTPTR